MKRILIILCILTIIRAGIGLGVFCVAKKASDKFPGKTTIGITSILLLAPDALSYQVCANEILSKWHDSYFGRVLVKPGYVNYYGYPAMLALLYTITGSNYIYGVILNAIFFMLIGLLAYMICKNLGFSYRISLSTAAIICIWPPSLAYSSIVLKDSTNILVLFLMLGGISLTLSSLNFRRSKIAWGLPMMGLGAYLFISIRPTLVSLIIAFIIVGLGAYCLASSMKGSRVAYFRISACGIVLLAGVWLGATSGLHILITQTTPPGSLHSNRFIEQRALAHGSAPSLYRPVQCIASSLVFPRLTQFISNQDNDLWAYRRSYSRGGLSIFPHAHIPPVSAFAKASIFVLSFRDFWLAPYPWQNWPMRGGNGYLALQIMVRTWMLMFYLLLPGIIYGLYRSIRKGDELALLILAWSAMSSILIGLISINCGTLLRHRDLAVLPSLLVGINYSWLILRSLLNTIKEKIRSDVTSTHSSSKKSQ